MVTRCISIMKLYAKVTNENEIELAWDNIKDAFNEEGKKVDYQSPYHTKDDGWYEIEREPDLSIGEYLEYNKELNTIEIKQRVKTQEQVILENFKSQYPIEKILELQDLAIKSLAVDVKLLPQEYQDYIAFKEDLK